MLVEHANLKYGYTTEGWDQAYTKEYGDLTKLRLKLLIEDEAIPDILNFVYSEILRLRDSGERVDVLDVGCGVGHQLLAIAA